MTESAPTITSFIQKAMARKQVSTTKLEPSLQTQKQVKESMSGATLDTKQYQSMETNKEPRSSAKMGKSMTGDVKRLATSLIDSFAQFQEDEGAVSPFPELEEQKCEAESQDPREELASVKKSKDYMIEIIDLKAAIENTSAECIKPSNEAENESKIEASNSTETLLKQAKELTIDDNAKQVDARNVGKEEWSVRHLKSANSQQQIPLELTESKIVESSAHGKHESSNNETYDKKELRHSATQSKPIEQDEEVERLRTELQCKEPKYKTLYKDKSDEKVPETTQSRANLIHAANQITSKIIKSITTILLPPQSVVNIIISYTAVLCLIDQSKSLIEDKRKTHKNCVTALQNIERVQKLTIAAIKFSDKLTDKEKKKLSKLKNKYLAGWDMRPEAFSDKYYSARVVLHFLVCLLECYEEKTRTRNSLESPTRLLIEHKTLKIQEAKAVSYTHLTLPTICSV
eukprot:TRINITY_DN6365_c0_g2_i6.p1 TRINITY_DN6365_c0_g2~~TRINITY_DN6365_c0_g2_i6.p1  ORF type:complete len:460 (+),score=120.95 TRINITY_DN6365_c0_g2_i6:154-1533(+)